LAFIKYVFIWKTKQSIFGIKKREMILTLTTSAIIGRYLLSSFRKNNKLKVCNKKNLDTRFLNYNSSKSQCKMKRFFKLFVIITILTSTNMLKAQENFKEDNIFVFSQPNLHLEKVDFWEHRAIPVFMATIGLAIAGIWTADIVSGKFSEQGGFFKWREGEMLLWPHIAAEGITSAGLIIGGIGLYNNYDWGLSVSMFSLGALTYTAINSSGWVLADKSRIPYGIPMWISLTGAIVSFNILL